MFDMEKIREMAVIDANIKAAVDTINRESLKLRRMGGAVKLTGWPWVYNGNGDALFCQGTLSYKIVDENDRPTTQR